MERGRQKEETLSAFAITTQNKIDCLVAAYFCGQNAHTRENICNINN